MSFLAKVRLVSCGARVCGLHSLCKLVGHLQGWRAFRRRTPSKRQCSGLCVGAAVGVAAEDALAELAVLARGVAAGEAGLP